MTSDLFRFLAFSLATGESVGCGSMRSIAHDLARADGVERVEILEFQDSAGGHVWEMFLPLHVARDHGETVYRSPDLATV